MRALRDVTVPADQLSDRALLLLILTRLDDQEDALSAITDALDAANAALTALKTDIAAEIQQVVDALASTADVQAAVDGLTAITAQLTEQSVVLQADDPIA